MKDEIEMNNGYVPKYFIESEKYINKSIKNE